MKKITKLLLATSLILPIGSYQEVPMVTNNNAKAEETIDVKVNTKFTLKKKDDNFYTLTMEHTNVDSNPSDYSLFVKSKFVNSKLQNYKTENAPKEYGSTGVKTEGTVLAMNGVTGTYKETMDVPKEALNNGELDFLIGVSDESEGDLVLASTPVGPSTPFKDLIPVIDKVNKFDGVTPLLSETQPVYFSLKDGETFDTSTIKWEPIKDNVKAENILKDESVSNPVTKDKYESLGFINGNKSINPQSEQTTVADKTSVSDSSNKSEQTVKEESSNTGLYIGIGSAILAVVGGAIAFFRRK